MMLMEDEKLSCKVWALPNVVQYQLHNGTSLGAIRNPIAKSICLTNNDHLGLLNFVRETKKRNGEVPTMP